VRSVSDVALSIVLGIGLAAATGFRVFLPMLIVSGAAYTGYLPGRQFRLARDRAFAGNAHRRRDR
jgi:uncharacterized protein DUF4126